MLDLIGTLLLLVVILVATRYALGFRRARGELYWPWLDNTRGDRAQQTYIAEEEIRRETEDRERPDVAP